MPYARQANTLVPKGSTILLLGEEPIVGYLMETRAQDMAHKWEWPWMSYPVLGNPTTIPGVGVTHLRYPVRKA